MSGAIPVSGALTLSSSSAVKRNNASTQRGARRLWPVNQRKQTPWMVKQKKKKFFLRCLVRIGWKGHLRTQKAFPTIWFHWGPQSTQRRINYLIAHSLTSLMKSSGFPGEEPVRRTGLPLGVSPAGASCIPQCQHDSWNDTNCQRALLLCDLQQVTRLSRFSDKIWMATLRTYFMRYREEWRWHTANNDWEALYLCRELYYLTFRIIPTVSGWESIPIFAKLKAAHIH